MKSDIAGRGIVLVLIAMSMFGWMDACSKLLAANLDPIQILWVRYVLSIPFALAIAAPVGIGNALRSVAPKLQVLRIVIVVVEMGLVVVAYRMVPLANAQAVFAMTPLLVTALSVPILGEAVGWRRWLAVGVGLVGVLIVVRPGFTAMQPGLVLAFICAVMYAVYNVLTRMVGRVDRSETSILWQILLGSAMLTLVGPFFWTAPTLREWLLLGTLATLGVMGHFLVIRALATAPAVVIQPFTYTMLLWAIVVGYLVFGDVPDGWTLVGAAIIVGSGLYAAVRERARATATA